MRSFALRPLTPVLGCAILALVVGIAAPLLRPSAAQDASQAVPEPVPAGAQPPIAPLPPIGPEGAAGSAAVPGDQAQAQAVLPATEQRLTLRTLTAAQLHARLVAVLGEPLPLLPDDGSGWMRFALGAEGAQTLIAAHAQTREVRMVGRPDQLRAWREIITAFDAPVTPERVTQVAAARQGAVNMLLAQAQIPAQQGAQTATGPEGLLGPVQIEVVEGTDFFVIRGNPRDVERVMEVIRQIEEMARVSEPQVVVHPLAHVDSQAIAALLQRLFATAAADGDFTLGTYYGRLLALPMGRPNAVLLVGPPSTVAKAEQILNQLDVAADTATQFEVFRLRFASAEASQTLVEELFTPAEADEATPPAFGPKALVIAELRTNSLIVRASPSDMQEVRSLINEIDRPSGDAVNELRVFKLRHSLASTLAPVLQRAVRGEPQTGADADAPEGLASLLRMVTIDAEGQQRLESGVLAGVTVNADPRANALVVSAPPDSMPLMAALIEQLDQPPDAVAELKVFTIRNGDAVSLAEMLQALFGTPTQQGGGGGGGAGAQAGANQVFQLRFSVDERTNSIIAAGSADELLVVEAILTRLDDGESRARLNRVYRLKNASAQDVALALQDWLLRKREIELTAPGILSPFSQLEREIVVVAEIASNSLIVSATPDYYEELEGIIKQLDEQAPMVMIQVLIGEVRLGDADEFGVELGLQDSVLFDRSLLEDIQTTTNTTTTFSPGGQQNTFEQQIIQSATLTPGFNFGNAATPLGNSGSDRSMATASSVAAQGLSSFAVNRVSPDLGFGGLVLSASSNSISMLLRALQESRRLEVLSRPQIMALDNQPGRAFVGQIVPIIIASQINQFGNPTNQIEQQPVGLELIVTPRINDDDLVVMTVAAAKRELGPVDQGVPIAIAANGDPVLSPIINSTEAQTTVSAMSGQTVVLSGLLTKRDEALHRRVPLLADIPLLGDLFRFDSTRLVRTELLIVLTPHVIRSRLESERIKQVESARMNWCLSDVVDLHGPAGLRSRTDLVGAAESETVYPALTPAELQQVAPLDGTGLTPTPAAPGDYGVPGDYGTPAESVPVPPSPGFNGVPRGSNPEIAYP